MECPRRDRHLSLTLFAIRKKIVHVCRSRLKGKESNLEAVEVFLRLRREKGKQSVCPSDGRRRGTKPADPLRSGSSNRIGTGDTHRDISVAHFSDVAAVKDDMDSGIGEKRILKTFPYSLLSLLYHRFQSPKPAFIFVQLLFPSFYFSPRPRACRWQMLKSSGGLYFVSM